MKGIWDKVFKNGPSKIFKGCLPQTLLVLLLNALSHIYLFIHVSTCVSLYIVIGVLFPSSSTNILYFISCKYLVPILVVSSFQLNGIIMVQVLQTISNFINLQRQVQNLKYSG